MDWKRDLDELIASTMALAKDIKPKSTSELDPVVRTAEQALADRLKPTTIEVANVLTSERDEILRRVGTFRAHQEKTARDREEYYLKMKAIMTAPPVDPAALSDRPAPSLHSFRK